MSGNPTPVAPTLEERVASHEEWRASAPAAITVTVFRPRIGWYKPTDTERAAFGAKYGVPASIDGVQVAIPAMTNPGDLEDAFARAALGFDPTGKRGAWGAFDLQIARSFSDRIEAAPTAKAADDILNGAGSMDTDAACFLVMTGYARFPGLGGSGSVGLGGATTIAQAVAAYLGQKTPGSGPGPSGR